MADAHELPTLYAGWMAELLGPIPRESNATCSDCAMCVRPDGELPYSTYYFDRSVKCCVYMPELPNFLAGRILADEGSPVGIDTTRRRIAARVAVSPLGVGRPPTYEIVYRNSAHTLGRSRSLRCPHYVEEGGGLCSIWRNRENMCTTWFCRHVRGRIGSEFWRAARDLLALTEGTLARWCALGIGIDPEILADYVAREGSGPPQRVADGTAIDGQVDPAGYARLWGEWHGREEAFYSECAERVAKLAWSDVLGIGGPDLAILSAACRRGYERLVADGVPARLKVGAFQVAQHRAGGVRATTYSALDVVDLPTALLPHLPAFDGRPTQEILQELLDRHGVGIEPEFLRRLVDWGVLVPA